MARNKILDATNGIVAILTPLEAGERARVIQAALMVLGDSGPEFGVREGGGGGGIKRTPGAMNEKAYFDAKEPRTKGEELAVAARFREEQLGASASTKQELKGVIKEARRNFDDGNFRRDLENARSKGLFNRGTGKDSAVLSHYGQGYVDALPNRSAVKAARKPKRAGGRRKKKSGNR